MAIEFTKESTKYTWATNSYTFGDFAKRWDEAEMAIVTADVTENPVIAESINKTFLDRYLESIEAGESLSKSSKIKTIEEIGIGDAYWDYVKFLFDVIESIKFKETKKTSFTRPLSDGFDISDKINSRVGVVAKEALKLADVCNKVAEKSLQDKFGVVDRITRKPKIVATDVIVLQDYISKNSTAVLKDKVAFADVCNTVSVFLRDFADEIAVAYSQTNSPTKSFYSSLGLSDDETNNVGKIIVENLSVVETFKKYLPIIRKFYETVSIAESKNNQYKIIKNETATLVDLIIRACEGVLSDLHVINSPIDFDEFVEMAKSPTLFNTFMDFKVGEYEYKDAIVKVRLSTTTQETFPSLVDCTMHVDIPDTDDRGTVEITDATTPTKVHYNKFYYNPPEVIVVLRGGNTADGMITPNIVSTDLSDNDGRYFEVELLDSYGNRKAGSISWTSKGY